MMNNEILKKDLYRYYGRSKETLKQKLFRPNELKYIFAYRRCREAKNKFSYLYYRFKLRKISLKTAIQIPWNTDIGEGLYIGHQGRVIINANAKLEKNINIGTGVTIGQENRGKRQGVPIIKDNVWIGTNAVIVGNITIGTDVLISPLAFINFDVPDHSIVIGNPGKVIAKGFATENYITNTV